MTLNIKYRPVKAFLLAVDSGSFTHAAGILGVTQPSFTTLIQDLESTLGVRLFERSTRSIQLTEAGRDFLSRIQRPLADVEEAYRSVLDLSASNRGTVVIGTLPSAAFAVVPSALASLREAHPALIARVIEAHNDELLAMLRTNQVECVIATLTEAAPDLVFEPVIADAYCAVYPATHPLAALKTLAWDDLSSQELILLAQGSSARTQFDRALQRKTAPAPVVPRYDVTHIITAAAMVRRGLGVAVLPRISLPDLNLDGLGARVIDATNAHRSIGLLYRRDRVLSPAIQRFVAHLHKVAPEVEAGMPPLPAKRRRKSP